MESIMTKETQQTISQQLLVKSLTEALEEILLIIPPKPKLPIVIEIKEVCDNALESAKKFQT